MVKLNRTVITFRSEEITVGSTVTTYIGWAEIGSTTSDAVWRIAKIVETTSGGTVTSIETWADKNQYFDNIWDNRASLTYG